MSEDNYARAIRDVVEWILKGAADLRDDDAPADADAYEDVALFVRERFGFSPETCPTCGGTGPDTATSDFDSGMLEAECGDEWHDGQSSPRRRREDDPLAGLPPDLAAVLRDQSVVVPQDGVVFALIAEWMNAKSDTLSASPAVEEKYRGLAGKLGEDEPVGADRALREKVAEAIIRAWREADPSNWWYGAADAALAAIEAQRESK